jgi:hypothetical protein
VVDHTLQIEGKSRWVSLGLGGKDGPLDRPAHQARFPARQTVFLLSTGNRQGPRHSTVTLLAKFLGLSTSVPRAQAV